MKSKGGVLPAFAGVLPASARAVADFVGILPAFAWVLPAFAWVLPAFDGILPSFGGVLPAFAGVLPDSAMTVSVFSNSLCDKPELGEEQDNNMNVKQKNRHQLPANKHVLSFLRSVLHSPMPLDRTQSHRS